MWKYGPISKPDIDIGVLVDNRYLPILFIILYCFDTFEGNKTQNTSSYWITFATLDSKPNFFL